MNMGYFNGCLEWNLVYYFFVLGGIGLEIYEKFVGIGSVKLLLI